MHRLAPIPKELYSEETEQPFEHCFDCGCHLHESGEGYVIQKAVSNGETVLEIAICENCHKQLQEDYSKETKERIWNFYLDKGNLDGRLQRFAALPPISIKPWVETCTTCNKPLTEASEYVIAAQGIGKHLVFGETPMMFCGDCMEQLINMLSEKSRDTYNDWIDRCLPSPPEAKRDLIKNKIFI